MYASALPLELLTSEQPPYLIRVTKFLYIWRQLEGTGLTVLVIPTLLS